jgi:hypothetical protein
MCKGNNGCSGWDPNITHLISLSEQNAMVITTSLKVLLPTEKKEKVQCAVMIGLNKLLPFLAIIRTNVYLRPYTYIVTLDL